MAGPTRTIDATEWLPSVLVGVSAVVLLVTAGALLRDRTPAVDTWALDALRVPPESPAETAVSVASEAFLIVAAGAAAAAIGLLLQYRQQYGWRRVLPPVGAYTGLFLLLASSSELLKPVFDRAHPSDPTEEAFPSTHVTVVTVAALIATGIGWQRAPRWRAATGALACAFVAGTAATRVLLGEHHLTDVTVTALGYTGATLLGVRLLPLPSRSPRQAAAPPASTRS